MKQFVLSALTAICFSASAEAGVIFTDNFETPVNNMNWQVYQQISGGEWTATQGTGIEIQTSGVVVQAHSGNQYIELDSDISRGGSGNPALSNSAMTRNLTGLEPGNYLLEYFYQPRTGSQNDNTIGVYFDGGELFSNLLDTADGAGANGWIKRSVSFFVGEDNATRRLSFRAEGTENTLGGFIDTVSLQYLGRSGQSIVAVTEPGSLVLFSFSLAGLGFASRRRR
ncbi:PEP-CTERM sorting domain-containing protein [Pelagibius sp. Alg239-R121]|uniref:PEP-CTERM sorting domain-containing protein n=1 Tax=Pelagibius sp. Alg239-R121 TaxID=2993448 RepID=UPI0024A6A5D0|nr:PEP-CTERM sorting domain-containing protein [Pelagibius sp. Alg239-R121]